MDAWKIEPVALKFRLGELTVARATLRLAVDRRHFSELPTAAGGPAAPDRPVPDDCDGALFRSYPVEGAVSRFAHSDGFIRYVPSQYSRYHIDLTGTLDGYLAKFSAKSRSTLKRKVKAWAQHCGGAIDLREYRTPAEAAQFYELARTVSAKTYQERLLDAGLPPRESFRDEMTSRAGRDAMRGYLLFHDGRPVAYLYCPIDSRALLYQYLGYDPDYAKWSPGTVLQWLVVERLFAEGRFAMFDFTEGQGAHKEFFATGSRRCADVYFLRSSLRNRLLTEAHSSLDALSRAGVTLLDRLGLKARIKRLLRRA